VTLAPALKTEQPKKTMEGANLSPAQYAGETKAFHGRRPCSGRRFFAVSDRISAGAGAMNAGSPRTSPLERRTYHCGAGMGAEQRWTKKREAARKSLRKRRFSGIIEETEEWRSIERQNGKTAKWQSREATKG